MAKMMGYVAVEGSVGAGKTTLLDGLRRAGFSVLQEPVEEWTRPGENGVSPLQAAYSDPGRHTLSFQVRVLSSKSAQIEAMPAGGGLTVIERDPFDPGTFLGHALANGLVTAQEHDDISYLASELRRARGWTRLGAIYLQVPPGECLRRVRERGRPEESDMSPLYMEELHRAHDARYAAVDDTHVIDASSSAEDVLVSAIAYLRGLEGGGAIA